MDVACEELAHVARSIHSRYTGVVTAWTDNVRGVTPEGALSCWGGNITDQRMVSKDGHPIPYLRTDNHDEYVGVIDPARVVVNADGETLAGFLASLGERIAYAGLSLDGSVEPVVAKVAIRLQNAFVGVGAGGVRQVAPSNFSYQTADADDPRNLLLVFTPTGSYAHVDGVGATPLLAHELAAHGRLRARWFEVQASDCAVGTTDARRGGGAAIEIGIRGSGHRANRMLVVSVPLRQRTTRAVGGPVYRSCGGECGVGVARAAILSVGEAVGEAAAVCARRLVLDRSEPVVVTQIDYNTLEATDAAAARVGIDRDAVECAIGDMERQYGMCDAACTLSRLPAMLRRQTADPFCPTDAALKTCK